MAKAATAAVDDGPSLWDDLDLDEPSTPFSEIPEFRNPVKPAERPPQPTLPPDFGYAGTIKAPPRECRCGVPPCPAQWVGARRHPTRGWLWMCHAHQVAEWHDIDAEFAAAEEGDARP